jgi:hypothetical protein
MALPDYAASVQGLALRITPLLETGLPDTTQGASKLYYVTRQFLSVGFTPEYEDGDEITEKNADGTICVQYKAKDTLKQVTLNLNICAPEPEVYALLAGGTKLTDATNSNAIVGWQAPVVGSEGAPPVCLEVWSRAVVKGKMPVDYPYWHWVFPQASLRLTGDRTLENGLLANTFDGFGVGNEAASTALQAYLPGWNWSTASPFQYARVAALPTETVGWGPVPPPAPAPVQLTSSNIGADTVTLTWAAPQGAPAVAGYTVRRLEGPDAPTTLTDGTPVTLTAATATTVTDTGLTSDTQYSYSVFAAYAGGTSAPVSLTVRTTTV